MLTKTPALFLTCLLTSSAIAQQDPLYSLYINNPFVLNPAYGGMTNNLNTSVSCRNQWVGLADSPQTSNANAHISLFENKMGAGLILVSDKIGASTVNEAWATYSYRARLNSEVTLAFGIQGGVSNHKINNSKVNKYDATDPLFQDNYSETSPSVGAGMILTSDRFFVGLSVPRMLKSELHTEHFQTTLYNQHFYALGSYIFTIQERIRLKPSVLVKKASNAPVSVDLNAALIFFENYQGGILTRDFNTYGLFVQALFSNVFRFGYVFEVPTGASVGANFTTHEITIGVRVDALPGHSNMSIFSF